MLKKVCASLLIFGFVGFVFYGGSAIAKKQDSSIQIKGSDTMVNLIQAWAEKFMESNPDILIAVTGGGSGTGFAALINGTCDVAMSSREIRAQEKELALKKGISPIEHKVALDGLAVVVSPQNPVSKLTIKELADIFTGRVRNWKEVGGRDQEIVLLSREVNSGTHVYFKEHILRKGDSKSKEEFASHALLLPSSQAIADEINHNTGAIGYYGMGYISSNQKAVSIAGDSGEYLYPVIADVSSGKYPISRPLYIYTNGEPQGNLKKFLDYMVSEEGQQTVSEQDFIPIQK
jgi:phosphate transport system substrate-binding protein